MLPTARIISDGNRVRFSGTEMRTTNICWKYDDGLYSEPAAGFRYYLGETECSQSEFTEQNEALWNKYSIMWIEYSLENLEYAVAFQFANLENLDGYGYDESAGWWSCYQAYIEPFSNADVVVGLYTFGPADLVINPVMLYFKMVDLNGELLFYIDSVNILIHNHQYHFSGFVRENDMAAVMLGSVGYELLTDLANAPEMTILIVYDKYSTTFTVSQDELEEALKPFAQSILDINYYAVFDEETLSLYDAMFNAAVE